MNTKKKSKTRSSRRKEGKKSRKNEEYQNYDDFYDGVMVGDFLGGSGGNGAATIAPSAASGVVKACLIFCCLVFLLIVFLFVLGVVLYFTENNRTICTFFDPLCESFVRGCNGVINSGEIIDACGVCGGNNSTCK
jgi:hypothetical protein